MSTKEDAFARCGFFALSRTLRTRTVTESPIGMPLFGVARTLHYTSMLFDIRRPRWASLGPWLAWSEMCPNSDTLS